MPRESPINQTLVLTTTSMATLVLATLHITDDIVFKISPGGLSNLIVVLMSVVWLYGTLALAARPAGYIITLVGSVFAVGVAVIHMRGVGLVGGRIGATNEAFFFVWTVLAMGTTAAFSAVLSARALWYRPWRRQP